MEYCKHWREVEDSQGSLVEWCSKYGIHALCMGMKTKCERRDYEKEQEELSSERR